MSAQARAILEARCMRGHACVVLLMFINEGKKTQMMLCTCVLKCRPFLGQSRAAGCMCGRVCLNPDSRHAYLAACSPCHRAERAVVCECVHAPILSHVITLGSSGKSPVCASAYMHACFGVPECLRLGSSVGLRIVMHSSMLASK
eukprot:366546-Chlamydomonas_euryale.AAC.34